MSDWQVLIVENDKAVASVHRRVAASQPGFEVAAVATSSEQAHALLNRGIHVDLILLEICLPGVDGSKLMRVVRAKGGPEAIAVTSKRDAETVAALLHLGVIDYLVKPFAIERLQQALLRFGDRKRILAVGSELRQPQIDALYADPRRGLLPKGLQTEILQTVLMALDSSGNDFAGAEQLARRASVARVTARRYLEYLVQVGSVEVSLRRDGPGRPRKLYRIARAGL